MCGIAGIIDNRQRREKLNRDILKKMSDIIVHRGPDAEGHWLSESNRCGFAFRRLSIVDLSADGNQPMKSLNRNLVVVFNGEIYNHNDIRKDLVAKGYKYQSRTDTETLINGYAEYGEEILQKMFGMWGFAIWDDEKQELFAARDRIGIKPFYYYYKNGVFVFGSEIKSILQHPDVQSQLNIDELPNYLNLGISSNKHTLFKDIHKLPAGHCLKLDKEGNLSIRRYWSPFVQCSDKFSMSFEEVYEELISLLRTSVEARKMGDVPYVVYLSGGIDSSLNVALMSELIDRPVDTFTVGFADLQKYNELEYAHQIAEKFKTNHKEIIIDQDDGFEVLEKLPYYEDEPNSDPVSIPLYYLTKLTREQNATIALVGEGSDEQFCGYRWMLRDYKFIDSYFKMFSVLPKFIKQIAYAGMSPLLNFKNLELATDFMRRGVEREKFYWSGQPVFTSVHLNSLLTKEYRHLRHYTYKYVESMYSDMNELYPKADIQQQMLYTEITHRLPELLLQRIDKIGMANSIEARVPFLDHRLVEFTMSIPQKMKVPDDKTTKFLLKKAVEPVLPHNIIYRKKQGFLAPTNEWMRTAWYDYAYENIINSEFAKLGIIDKKAAEAVLKKNKEGKIKGGAMIYSLLNLNLWYKIYMA